MMHFALMEDDDDDDHDDDDTNEFRWTPALLMGGSIFTAATNLPLRVGLERCQTTASTLPQRSHLPNQGKRPKENKE
jgi:hypothetical protein